MIAPRSLGRPAPSVVSELRAARGLLAALDKRPLPKFDHVAIRLRIRNIDRVLAAGEAQS